MNSVLVIAGSDPSGGAGMSRDIETLAHLGVRALCALTAITVQTDQEFRARELLSATLVRTQIDAALASHRPGAVKVGMLGAADIVAAVAAALPARAALPLVLDPVLRSSSGGALLDAGGLRALRELLLPRTTLLTPNIPEAALLLGRPHAVSEDELLQQANALLALGPQAVLLKGGHAQGDCARDLLLQQDRTVRWLAAARQPGARRGTGCVLASAVAAHLAGGEALSEACVYAKQCVSALWQASI